LPLPEGEFTNQHLPRPEEFKSLEAVYRGHPHLPELRPLIGRAIEAAWQLPLFPGFGTAFRLRDVVIHGDCKAENFLFDSGGRAVGLLDWDSVGYGHILVDIAEMLRSWGHDEVALANAEAVLSGYAETGLPLQDDDLDLLPPVLRAIVLNLARRYLTDALAEVYFKWDREAYPSLFLQNRARAEKMLNLADYLLDHEPLWAETLKRGYRQASRLFPDEN
jgi:Putative homoserine kinase type II (protein kinase fold)